MFAYVTFETERRTPSKFGIKLGLTSILLVACLSASLSNTKAQSISSKESAATGIRTDDNPLLSGGYVEYWNNMLDRPKAEWESVLANMRAAKMSTVILKHLVYKDNGGAEYPFIVPREAQKKSDLGATDPTKLILEYADSKHHPMDVYIGLWEDQAWSESAFNSDYLKAAKEKNSKLIERLSALYGDHPSFKGWYISLEPWNLVNDSAKVGILNDFLVALSAKCKEADKKRNKIRQVALSIFFNKDLAPPSDVPAIYGDGVLKNSGINIVLLQDSIAVNGWSDEYIPVLKQYFEAFRLASHNNGMRFWAIVENFEPGHHSTTVERLTGQLSAERDYTNTFVTFDYYHYMNPVVSNVPLAPLSERQKLYTDYKGKIVDQMTKP